MTNKATERDILPDKFRTGMKPTGEDFESLIHAATNASELAVGIIKNARLNRHINLTDNANPVDSSVTADQFFGDGSTLTNLHANAITTGTVQNARLNRHINLTDNANPVDSSVTADQFFGDGSTLTNLHANAITTGTVQNDRLTQADEFTSGIVRFATQAEVENGSDNVAVTATQLKQQDGFARQYIDKEIAFLDAGVKFKKGVVGVIETPVDVTAGEPFPLLDGYQVQLGDRVLLVGQINTTENRVWIASENNQWHLAEDLDGIESNELYVGVSVEVIAGETEQQSIWSVIEYDDADHIRLTWKKRNDINTYVGNNGITVENLTISTDTLWLEKQIKETDISAENIIGLETAARGVGVFDIAQLPTATVSSNSNTGVSTAQQTKMYVDSELASAINQTTSVISQSMPIGAIILWSGVTIPTGWHLCDGSNNTPNLRDRFIVGAGSTYKVGDVGGQNSVVLNQAESGMPAHTISATTSTGGAHTHYFNDYHYIDEGQNDLYSTESGDDIGNRTTSGNTTASGGSHAHSFSTTVAGRNASAGHENRPPYYSLSYIMKVV